MDKTTDNKREKLEKGTIDINEAKELLDSLRWTEDMVITNYEGERVWLKPCYIDGKRVGITDCCLESDPCDYHKKLATQKRQ